VDDLSQDGQAAASPWTDPSQGDRRPSAAEKVAATLRARVLRGALRPGERLSEESLGLALGVSRNTLREAFRLLADNGLLVHELNRGVFVRTLTPNDIRDLYQVRRIIEGAAARSVLQQPDANLNQVASAVADGEAAAQQDRWADVATADLLFHQHLVGLCASPRLDGLMQRVLAELRLVFHRMPAAAPFHRPYLVRNRQILTLLQDGDGAGAEKELMRYLDDAERELLAATPPTHP
jgi:DNA-binding GntR family transcriptional regulator